MKNTFVMSRHATNYVYMYDEAYIERKPIIDNDNRSEERRVGEVCIYTWSAYN